MPDEDKLAQDTARAARAQALLSNELLDEAFTTLADAYTAAWRSTTVDEVAGREKLYLAINIIGKVKEHLVTIVNDGKLAASQLRELAQTAEREKRWQDVK